MPLNAQEITGTISGTVTDSSEAIIPDATVTVTNLSTRAERNTTTTSAGVFFFTSLPIGDYTLRVSKEGFKQYQRTSIHLDVNQKLSFDVTLQVGATTQQVTVTGETAAVETSTGMVSNLVGSEQTQALPLNGRAFNQLVDLVPGVAPDSGQVVFDGSPLHFTRSTTAILTGQSDPGASVFVGLSPIATEPDGRFSVSLSLAEGTNVVTVRAADWFHLDPTLGQVPGNEAAATLTIIRDSRPPVITVTAPSTPTNSDIANVRGRIAESISPNETYDPASVEVEVGGRRAWVLADGSFSITAPLTEGANSISLSATDLAGNIATATVDVTRDSIAPALQLDAVPSTTTSPVVNITGSAEPGVLVFVNGFVVRQAADGTFHREVPLSGGSNVIVIRVEDAAGNSAERTLSIAYVARSGGSSAGAWAAIAVVIAIVAGLGIAFLFGRVFIPGSREVSEAPPLEAQEIQPEAVEPATEVFETPAPPPPTPLVAPAAPTVDEKISKIEGAYAAGKITRDVYERNLAALGREPPPEAPIEPTPAPQPTVEERATKLRTALEEGRISREAYESNLAKLGLAPEPPAVPSVDEQSRKLEDALRAGRISEDAYRANLARLGLSAPAGPAAPPPEPESVPTEPPVIIAPPVQDKNAMLENAFREGRISREMYEANLAKLRRPAIPPPPPAPVEDRAERLAAAYREGRITEEAYRANLARSGAPPPPEAPAPAQGSDARTARLDQALREGRISREAYEANLAKLGPSPPPSWAATDDRIARLEMAYREGRITEEAYRTNLDRLGGRRPPPAAKVERSAEERATMLESAFREGRISRETYEANLAKLGVTIARPAEDAAAVLRRAHQEGKVDRTLYARNLIRILGVSADPRVANLESAFLAGKIDAELFEKNLRRLKEPPR